MSFEEQLSHREWIDLWKKLNADTWRKYANNENNDKLLQNGAERFRPCSTAVSRSFHENKSLFVRTDGKSAEDDNREAAERAAATAAELEANTTVDVGFIEYAMSLAPLQIAQAYYADPNSDFSRKYRLLVREHGFRLPQNSQRQGRIQL